MTLRKRNITPLTDADVQVQSVSVVANNSINRNACFHEDEVEPEMRF